MKPAAAIAGNSHAAAVARALGGGKCGSGYMAPCPAHDDRMPSLSIALSDRGELLVHCHAGCSQERVIASLRQLGLWRSIDRPMKPQFSPRMPPRTTSGCSPDAKSHSVERIWQSSRRAEGTLVETYLQTRGLVLPVSGGLRFHPALRHPSGTSWPAMLARLSDCQGKPLPAIHRTFLARDGLAKAPVTPSRMMLGSSRGASVHLAPTAAPLLVGEGIETCLAAMQATGHPAWAALSTSGLRSLVLPPGIRDIVVLADGDDPGEAAARDCARRLNHEGCQVRIARPPRGSDFNDLLLQDTPSGRANRNG